MTQEEKAKRYDEAITKARNIVNSINVGLIGKDSFEAVFPELKESEDEKIRKEILDYIIKGSESCYDVQQYGKERFEKWIAWLEKQGEQKTVIKMKTPEESLGIDSETYSKIVDECIYGEQKPIKEHNACEFCEDRYGCVSPCSMKLIEEEKPAWSEEDRDILFRTIDNLKFLRDTISIDPKYAINIIDIEREINWLKHLKDRYAWRPSDEQMLAINTAINVLGKGTINGKYLIELQEQLLKLMEE